MVLMATAALCLTAYILLPSSPRDRRGEGINRAGYSAAFYALDRALEEYGMRHYGQVPQCIEQLAAAEMSELGDKRNSTLTKSLTS